MVVSAAFGELTEVLERLESSDAAVRNVDIGEQFVDERDEITADLTVGVPVLDGVELLDGVSVEAENFDLKDECVNVDLTVTLAVDETETTYRSGSARAGGSTSRSNGVPAYKDPEALRAVYEKHDTFPEMTEALGADVTSETVRRYMVEYDIHDPSDSGPSVQPGTAVESTGDAANGNDGNGEASAADGENTDDFGHAGRNTAETPDARGTHDASTDEGTAEDDGTATDESPSTTERDEASVAELIAATDGGDGDDSLVADGFGIPRDLTVSELATVVNGSNTVYEVKQRLDVDQDHARRLLNETALLDLVTQRIGAEQIRVSPREVRRRIERNSSA